MSYTIEYYSEQVQSEILDLPKTLLARFLHFSRRMETYGPNLGMPHARHMAGGLLELRLKGQEGIARVLYCALVKNRIVVLHCFIKKTDKTPPKELAIGRRRLKEVTSHVDS